MPIRIEITADNTGDLVAQLALLASTFSGVAMDEKKPATRGRPPKVEVVQTTAAEERVVAAPAAQTAPAETKPAATAGTDVKVVRAALLEVVKRFGRDACGSICQEHGAPNLSALDPSTFPSVLAAANKLLEAPVEVDPAE